MSGPSAHRRRAQESEWPRHRLRWRSAGRDASSCRKKDDMDVPPLKRVAIFQIRSRRFSSLFLRMSPETGAHFRETCFRGSAACLCGSKSRAAQPRCSALKAGMGAVKRGGRSSLSAAFSKRLPRPEPACAVSSRRPFTAQDIVRPASVAATERTAGCRRARKCPDHRNSCCAVERTWRALSYPDARLDPALRRRS
jgi:hypothetical protein